MDFKNVIMNFSKSNYIKIRNIVIFIDPDSDDFIDASNIIKKGYRVHIFVTSTINTLKYLKEFINHINKESRIFIHIPKSISDLKVIVDDIIKYIPNTKSLLERRGPVFYIPSIYSELDINYDNDSIIMNIQINRHLYENYKIYNSTIKTFPQKYRPELFKDVIIKNFKKSCPDEILNTFSNDDDIWNYIKNKIY